MIIRKIDFSGIRSWEKASFEFDEGFTVLLGPKGAGKSSVVIGIIFALLGDRSPLGYNSILRDQANSAKIRLTLESQGEKYTLTRSLLRKKGKIQQDPSALELRVNDEIIAREKSRMIAAEIRTRLGQFKELINYTWYVRQESLKELLDMMPGDRKSVIDRLFRFQTFNRAFEEIRSIENIWKGKRIELEKDKAKYDLDALQIEYNELVTQLDQVKKTISAAEKKATRLEKLYLAAQQKADAYFQIAKQYDEQKAVLDELNLLRNQEETNLKNASSDQQKWQQEEVKNQKQIQSLKEKIQKFWNTTFITKLSLTKQTLESLNEHQLYLQKKIVDLSSNEARSEQSLSELRDRETALQEQENCVYCGQPLSSHQALEFRKHRSYQIKKLDKELKKFSNQKKRTESELNRLTKSKAGLETLQTELGYKVSHHEDVQTQLSTLTTRITSATQEMVELDNQIKRSKETLPKYDRARDDQLRQKAHTQNTLWYKATRELDEYQHDKNILERDLEELSKNMLLGKEKSRELQCEVRREDWLSVIRRSFKEVLPQLRTNYIQLFEEAINNIYSRLNHAAPMIEVNQDYTPILHYGPYERTSDSLSGGERTEIAIAYRIALGNTVSRAQTGKPLELLVLDEPTENLGNEDQSIARLAELLSELSEIKQIIAITHDTTLAEYASKVYQIDKTRDISKLNQNL